MVKGYVSTAPLQGCTEDAAELDEVNVPPYHQTKCPLAVLTRDTEWTRFTRFFFMSLFHVFLNGVWCRARCWSSGCLTITSVQRSCWLHVTLDVRPSRWTKTCCNTWWVSASWLDEEGRKRGCKERKEWRRSDREEGKMQGRKGEIERDENKEKGNEIKKKVEFKLIRCLCL